MQIFIFIVGLCVTVMVFAGLVALVPKEMRPPDEVYYRASKEEEGVKF